MGLNNAVQIVNIFFAIPFHLAKRDILIVRKQKSYLRSSERTYT